MGAGRGMAGKAQGSFLVRGTKSRGEGESLKLDDGRFSFVYLDDGRLSHWESHRIWRGLSMTHPRCFLYRRPPPPVAAVAVEYLGRLGDRHLEDGRSDRRVETPSDPEKLAWGWRGGAGSIGGGCKMLWVRLVGL